MLAICEMIFTFLLKSTRRATTLTATIKKPKLINETKGVEPSAAQ